jgi:hypothetical protein
MVQTHPPDPLPSRKGEKTKRSGEFLPQLG